MSYHLAQEAADAARDYDPGADEDTHLEDMRRIRPARLSCIHELCGEPDCPRCGESEANEENEPAPDVEPLEPCEITVDPLEEGDHPKTCRHGNDPSDCGACDHEGDLAYDAWRESR